MRATTIGSVLVAGGLLVAACGAEADPTTSGDLTPGEPLSAQPTPASSELPAASVFTSDDPVATELVTIDALRQSNRPDGCEPGVDTGPPLGELQNVEYWLRVESLETLASSSDGDLSVIESDVTGLNADTTESAEHSIELRSSIYSIAKRTLWNPEIDVYFAIYRAGNGRERVSYAAAVDSSSFAFFGGCFDAANNEAADRAVGDTGAAGFLGIVDGSLELASESQAPDQSRLPQYVPGLSGDVELAESARPKIVVLTAGSERQASDGQAVVCAVSAGILGECAPPPEFFSASGAPLAAFVPSGSALEIIVLPLDATSLEDGRIVVSIAPDTVHDQDVIGIDVRDDPLETSDPFEQLVGPPRACDEVPADEVGALASVCNRHESENQPNATQP